MARLGRPPLDRSPIREKIILVAKKVFCQRGFHKAHVEQICDEALVGKTSFYRYFSDKVDLGVVVFQEFLSDELARAHFLLENQMSFQDKLKLLMQETEKNRNELGLLFQEEFFSLEDERVFKVLKKSKKKFSEVNRELLKQGQSEKVLPDSMTPVLLELLLKKRQQFFADKELQALIPSAAKRFHFVNSLFFKGAMTLGASS